MANKANINRDSIDDHPMRNTAQMEISKAGVVLKPADMEYQASFTVHCYERKDSIVPTYAFVCQASGANQIEEGQADLALKELKRAMMALYGREAPKERA